VLLSRFMNKLNYAGKRTAAEKIMYEAMDIVREKTKEDPINVFNKAIDNIKPMVEVKARRVGGANYQVPIEVKPNRGTTLAMRWIINAARERKGVGMGAKVAEELILAFKKEGAAFKKREDMHRMAEANRAFAHYRW
jgi:small subunit ribosomal protein S7